MRTAYEPGSGAEPWLRPVAEDRDTVVANLFVLHHRRLVGLAALLVDDRRTAEDVVQEAFLGLYRRCTSCETPTPR